MRRGVLFLAMGWLVTAGAQFDMGSPNANAVVLCAENASNMQCAFVKVATALAIALTPW